MSDIVNALSSAATGAAVISLVAALRALIRTQREWAKARAEVAERRPAVTTLEPESIDQLELASSDLQRLITSLTAVKRAAFRLGPLLVVKYDDNVVVRRLSMEEQADFERAPGMLASPEALLNPADSPPRSSPDG